MLQESGFASLECSNCFHYHQLEKWIVAHLSVGVGCFVQDVNVWLQIVIISVLAILDRNKGNVVETWKQVITKHFLFRHSRK